MALARRRPAKTSTALAKRKTYHAKLGPVARLRRVEVLPAEPSRSLNDDITLGDLGLVEIKLRPREEMVLSEPVNEAEVLVKPTGQLYLSHPSYTKLFNRAFGRLGWQLIPAAKQMKDNRSVVVPYILYIHARPAAFAWGEQEYFESNKEQTFGDAIEATNASALRRCAKRLGVTLELWDRKWLDNFLFTHCVRVKVRFQVEGREKESWKWRRKTEPRFWNEVGNQPAGHHANSENKITEPQQTRLWAITSSAGRTNTEVKTWLLRTYKIATSRDIIQRDYKSICEAIEKPGVLGATV